MKTLKDYEREFDERFANPFGDIEPGEKILAYSVDSKDAKSFISTLIREVSEQMIIKEWDEEEKLMDGFPLLYIQARNAHVSEQRERQKRLLEDN